MNNQKLFSAKEQQSVSYGNWATKVCPFGVKQRKKGKIVLVTATNPTPAGEGKTTTTIGIVDALNKLGYKAIGALREPSMGPVFGRKGCATGGGKAQLKAREEINLHFTGDIHAVTSANNLVAAVVDKHIRWGNQLGITQVTWKRCLDVNDAALRSIKIVSPHQTRWEQFQISAASEIMAVLCLAKDLDDLRARLGKMVVGFAEEKPVYVCNLQITGALMVILKNAVWPNVVQTLEKNPVLVHGGPFANIAHGCNSLLATQYAQRKADFVITEAGFGSDLGAEKFFNIKVRTGGLKVSAVVLVTTVRALKLQGGSKNFLAHNSFETNCLRKGLKHLQHHIKILKTFRVPYVVAINKFPNDMQKDIDTIVNNVEKQGVPWALSQVYQKGSKGGVDLAKTILSVAKPTKPVFTYSLRDSLLTKLTLLTKNIYGGEGIILPFRVKEELLKIIKNKWNKLPVCVAKTPVSLSDDPSLLGVPTGWKLRVSGIDVSNGAQFLVVRCGKILTMPGLGRKCQAEKIDLKNNVVLGMK